jgi:hypothetical protein
MPIIFVSACIFENADEKSRQLGCQGLIAKPVIESELMLALRNQLDVEWIYADASSRKQVFNMATRLAFHGDTLTQLLQLTRMGHISGLRSAIEHIAATEPELAESCRNAKQLLDQFELGALEHALLENERDLSLA